MALGAAALCGFTITLKVGFSPFSDAVSSGGEESVRSVPKPLASTYSSSAGTNA